MKRCDFIQRLFFFSIWVTVIIAVFSIPKTQANDTLPSLINIHSFEEDITGDGLKDDLKLQGNYLSNDSDFFQHIILDINNSFQKEWNLSLKGGYEPKLSFYDLNHDEIIDFLYEVAIDTDKKQYFTQAYTLKNNKIESIDLPKNNPIKGIYRDDFRIELIFTPTNNKEYISIQNRNRLLKENVYNNKGEVSNEQYIDIDPIKKYIPILINKHKGYGLKSIQNMRHPSTKDLIGTIETLWYFDKHKNKWIILKTDWHQD